MKIKQEEFNKLPQLDRIEYFLKDIDLHHLYTTANLFIIASMIASIAEVMIGGVVNRVGIASLAFLILGGITLFIWFKRSRKLDEDYFKKYFKVVKK